MRRAARAHEATGANQVWSWDITYLKPPVAGVFFYLYVIIDIWSRKIVGWAVYPTENAEHAATVFHATCRATRCDPTRLALHADNGGPMKGATMVGARCTLANRTWHRSGRRTHSAWRCAGTWNHLATCARAIGRCRSTEPRLGNAPRPSLHRWWTFERSNRAVHGSAGGREAQ